MEKRPPPTAAEIEAARKRKRDDIPEGMTKSQWKKQLRLKRWEETKDEYRQKKRDKKKAAAIRRRLEIRTGDDHYHQAKKVKPATQKPTGVQIIIDCEFDELMNNKEIVSLSNQITRAYSAKRHCGYDVGLTVSSFNKNLKVRFDTALQPYKLWKGITMVENDRLADILPSEPAALAKYVYLTADTDEEVDELEPDHTYIIGGIVDKNRHKKLCLEKAQALGMRVAKLPIDKYIELNGRQVLATSHVYELCCKWFECGKDWGRAFNEVLPPRKVKKEEKEKEEKEGKEDEEEEEEEDHEDEEDEDEHEEDKEDHHHEDKST